MPVSYTHLDVYKRQFLHILILNAVYRFALPAIKDKLPGDRAVAVLGLCAFLLVDQMTVLLRDSFFAVLDLCLLYTSRCV